MGYLTSCRICDSHTKHFFDLGLQPLANSLLKRPDERENKYPLALDWCPRCNLVQLNYTVDPKKLFSKYVWVTATSKTARDFSTLFYKELIKRSSKTRENYVLEIASNDGTFLLPFIKNGYKVIGIDPAKNIAKIARKNGVPTRTEFWNSKTALSLVKERGPARIIFARNVLAHVANTKDFVRGLSLALQDDGVLAVEVHYAGSILEKLQYDSIYHEHLCYFTLKTLERLLNDSGLFVFDVMHGPISGGSLVVYAGKHRRGQSAAFRKLRIKEQNDKVNALESWRDFAEKSYAHRDVLADILQEVSQRGEYVVGYGSSARSSTLLNFCGFNGRVIKSIADQNSLKHGLFTAGTHIKIESPKKVMALKPSLVVVLAWNFAEEIIDILRRKLYYSGRILVPLPNKPRITAFSYAKSKLRKTY